MPQNFHCVVFDLSNKRKLYLLLNSLFLEEQSEQENIFQVEESQINFVFMPLFLFCLARINFITILISWPLSYLLLQDVTMPRIVVITDVSGQTNNLFNGETSQGEKTSSCTRPLFPTTLLFPSYDFGKQVGLRTYQHPFVMAEVFRETVVLCSMVVQQVTHCNYLSVVGCINIWRITSLSILNFRRLMSTTVDVPHR